MVNPDFVKVIDGFSIPAKKVVERKDLKNSLIEMLDAKGPYFLVITVEKEGNVFPMVEPGSSVSEIRLTY